MLVAIGKGIELDVDVTQFNSEVHDHIVRTGLRNLLMDAHASATAKGDPEGYVQKSRELAEKKLASLYAGIVRVQRLALINRLAAEYAQSHDVALRPRAEKIVALENEAEPLPVKKAGPTAKGKKAA
jgi:hypothetical protein